MIGYAEEIFYTPALFSGLFPDDTRNAAMAAFDQMAAVLDIEGMSLNHLVRQWNYIGNILAVNDGFLNYRNPSV